MLTSRLSLGLNKCKLSASWGVTSTEKCNCRDHVWLGLARYLLCALQVDIPVDDNAPCLRACLALFCRGLISQLCKPVALFRVSSRLRHPSYPTQAHEWSLEWSGLSCGYASTLFFLFDVLLHQSFWALNIFILSIILLHPVLTDEPEDEDPVELSPNLSNKSSN